MPLRQKAMSEQGGRWEPHTGGEREEGAMLTQGSAVPGTSVRPRLSGLIYKWLDRVA